MCNHVCLETLTEMNEMSQKKKERMFLTVRPEAVSLKTEAFRLGG